MFVTNWTNTLVTNIRIHFQWRRQFGCKKLRNISTTGITQNKLKRHKKQGHILWIKQTHFGSIKYNKSLQEGLIPPSTIVIRLTSWQTELDWTDSDVHNSRTVGEAELWDVWSHPAASEPVIKEFKTKALKLMTTKSKNSQTSGVYCINKSYKFIFLDLPKNCMVWIIQDQTGRCLVSNVLERMWKEVTVT